MIEAISESTRRLMRTVFAALAIIGGVIIAMVIFTILPALETRAMPVVKQFRIDKAEWLDRYRLQIFVQFDKKRPCKFVEQNWYAVHSVSGHEILERVRMTYADRINDEPTWSRPTGENRAGPWIVHIPPTASTMRYRTLIRHDCGLLWETETKPDALDLSGAFRLRPS